MCTDVRPKHRGKPMSSALQAWVSTKCSLINSWFFFNNFNVYQYFGVQDTLLSLNPTGLHFVHSLNPTGLHFVHPCLESI